MPSATANLPPRVTSLTSTPPSQLRCSAASTPSSSSSASPLSPSPSHSPPPSSCSPTPTAPVRLTGTISTPSGSVSPFSARKRIKREFGNWRSEIAFLFCLQIRVRGKRDRGVIFGLRNGNLRLGVFQRNNVMA
uniref:Uncharacterized protein n=1 Tax=Brassica oleracea var. oleracea TaxID=109376 RepID=A0A0D3BXR5_BRAOL